MRLTCLSNGGPSPTKAARRKGNGSDGLRPPPADKTFQEARKGPRQAAPTLSREASGRPGQLLAEIEGLGLADDLDAGHCRHGQRQTHLTPADGDEVRLAFQARLGRLQTTPDADPSARRIGPAAQRPRRSAPASTRACWPSPGASAARQDPSAVRRQATLSRVRAAALRCRIICVSRNRAAWG